MRALHVGVEGVRPLALMSSSKSKATYRGMGKPWPGTGSVVGSCIPQCVTATV